MQQHARVDGGIASLFGFRVSLPLFFEGLLVTTKGMAGHLSRIRPVARPMWWLAHAMDASLNHR